jgi:hypothetical protein
VELLDPETETNQVVKESFPRACASSMIRLVIRVVMTSRRAYARVSGNPPGTAFGYTERNRIWAATMKMPYIQRLKQHTAKFGWRAKNLIVDRDPPFEPGAAVPTASQLAPDLFQLGSELETHAKQKDPSANCSDQRPSNACRPRSPEITHSARAFASSPLHAKSCSANFPSAHLQPCCLMAVKKGKRHENIEFKNFRGRRSGAERGDIR